MVRQLMLLCILLTAVCGTSFIKEEIRLTQELISLYEQKIQLLKQAHNNQTQDSPNLPEIKISDIDYLLHQQSYYVKKEAQNHNVSVKLWNLKNKFKPSKFYSWMQITPIARQSNSQSLNMAIVIGEDTHITVFDIYGNLLLEFDTPEPIAQLRCSPTQRDSFISVMTTQQRLIVYDIEFSRRKNQTNTTVTNQIYNKKYKDLYNNYKYSIKPIVQRIQNQTETKQFRLIELNNSFSDFEVYFFKSEIRFVFWNKHHILQLNRIGKLLFETELSTDTFTMQHTSLMFTKGNQVGFLRQDGQVATKHCKAEHDVQLLGAVVDGMSAGHSYALTKDGDILVFKTSNLLQQPEATECYLETKFRVVKHGEVALGINSVRGALIVSTDKRNLYFNASTFMIQRFEKTPSYELPQGIECPFGYEIKEFSTQINSLILTKDLELFELQLPHLLKEKAQPIQWESLKGPIFAFIFGLVMVYQLFLKENAVFRRNKNKDDDDLGELGNSLKRDMIRKGKKMTPKMKNDVKEIEKMISDVSDLSKKLGVRPEGFD